MSTKKNQDHLISIKYLVVDLKVVQYILGNGKEKLEMEKEYRFGLMEQNMKASGNVTGHMGEENLHIQMEIFMMENGKMIWQMDMECIYMLMVLNMKDNGLMISNMDMDLKSGLMVLHIKGFLIIVSSMVKVKLINI